MKFLKIFFAFSLIIFISNCEKHSVNDCSKPFSSADKSGSKVTIVSDLKYNMYEVEYGSSGFELGTGTKTNSTSFSSLSSGNYDFYIRGNCGGNKWSDWSDVVTVNMTSGGGSSSCLKPNDVSSSSFSNCYKSISWDDANYSDGESDHYEVEYGPTGFTLGTGEVATVNYESFKEGKFAINTTYDVYIKANCGGSDWSDYCNVFSFFSEKNYNMCLKPVSLSAQRSGSVISFQFTSQGDCEFQYAIAEATTSINSVTLYTVTVNDEYTDNEYSTNSSLSYKLYARSKCKDGSFSDWAILSIP